MINIDNSAKEKIRELLKNNNQAIAFRIGISSGGCVGYKVNFILAEKITEKDETIDIEGMTIVVDRKSAKIIDGATLSFKKELMEEKFVLDIPEIHSQCSCGKSFSF